MTVALESDARKILSPMREGKIRSAFERAWTDWLESPERAKYSRWARTRANMVFERIAVRLLEAFADDRGVRFHFQDETIKIIFDKLLLVRCKKANERGLGGNVPTQANMAFCEAQSDLPGLPGLQKIEIVYLLNDTATAIENIVVQARDGDMRLWAYTLGGIEDGGASIVPLRPSSPPPSYDPADIVNPRQPTERDEESDED
ncbi:MAG: hypothetical protein AB7S71_06485 [Dongiaceae bacterium]